MMIDRSTSATLDRIFDEMYNLISEANRIPLTDKIIIEESDLAGILDDLKEAIPKEVKSATRLLEEQKAIVTKAHEEADNIVLQAKTEADRILELAKSLNFDEIITVGPHFKEVNASGVAFLTTQDLINYLTGNDIHSQNILLKASRGIALEKALEFIK